MTPVIRGRVWIFGDDVNTDVIMPGKYLTVRDPEKLAPHVMEGVDPEFARQARPGDLLGAGKNFGWGSSRETAPAALRAFGLAGVVAVSFARIFLRNAVPTPAGPVYETALRLANFARKRTVPDPPRSLSPPRPCAIVESAQSENQRQESV